MGTRAHTATTVATGGVLEHDKRLYRFFVRTLEEFAEKERILIIRKKLKKLRTLFCLEVMGLSIRENYEQFELQHLSPYATPTVHSKGRKYDEEPCSIRTAFQRDRDKIIHTKSFRRLMHKTQVFVSSECDHDRTRLTHTLEVSQIARTIARALGLNEDLTEAIALGHDLGHTPFGHLGEEQLNRIMPEGFFHNEQSIRVVEKIERDGKGLNLTLEVLDGIRNHRTNGHPMTLEGRVVQISDKIAYVNHDIDDAVRNGMIHEDELPKHCIALLGNTCGERIDFLVKSVIENSGADIVMAPSARTAMYEIRKFLFSHVYELSNHTAESEKHRAVIANLFHHYAQNIENLPRGFVNMVLNGEPPMQVVGDYVAGMTDRFALKINEELLS